MLMKALVHYFSPSEYGNEDIKDLYYFVPGDDFDNDYLRFAVKLPINAISL